MNVNQNLETKLRLAKKVIIRLCSYKYANILDEVRDKLGSFEVLDILKYTMNTYSLLAKLCGSEKIVIKITDNVHNVRILVNNNTNMLKELEKIDNIPTPIVLMKGNGYLVTSYIDGVCYSDCDDKVKHSVWLQLRDVVQIMKSVESCEGEYLDRTRTLKNVNDFEEAKIICPWIEPCNGESFVLSHNDLHGGNIIVKDGKLAGIIDWEYSGYYPRSYERLKYKHIQEAYAPFINLF